MRLVKQIQNRSILTSPKTTERRVNKLKHSIKNGKNDRKCCVPLRVRNKFQHLESQNPRMEAAMGLHNGLVAGDVAVAMPGTR